MSIIREILGLQERIEALAKEVTIYPPSDPALPFKVKATLIGGEEIFMEAYSIYLENISARLASVNQYVLENNKVSGYAREIKLYFPREALIIHDFGILRIT